MSEPEIKIQSYKTPLTSAIMIHIFALSILLLQFSFSRPTQDLNLQFDANIIEATVVSQSVLDAMAAQKAAEKAAQEALIAQQIAAEEKRIEEEKQAEAKKIADAKAAEQKRIAEKAAAEKKKAEEKAKAAREQALQQELAAETQAQQTAAMQRAVASEVEKYKLLVKQKVMQNWLVQAGFHGFSCQLLVRLAASGTVLEVRLVESSGDPAFDRSAVLAVQKAAPLPVPPTPQAFAQFREIRLTLRPE